MDAGPTGVQGAGTHDPGGGRPGVPRPEPGNRILHYVFVSVRGAKPTFRH